MDKNQTNVKGHTQTHRQTHPQAEVSSCEKGSGGAWLGSGDQQLCKQVAVMSEP